MKLTDQIDGCGAYRFREGMDLNMEIGAVKTDSRAIEAGDIFVALKGEYHDGHDFIPQALRNGATAVILEDESFCGDAVPWILVKNSREFYGVMEQNHAGKPSLKMNVIGVTGTNGKTTTTHMLAAIMEEAGKKVGLLGTIYNRVGDEALTADLTTPDSRQLAEMFRRMAETGTDYAIMEVSSHALAQSRTAGIEFDLGIFTNLTQDHLDYHGTADAYMREKAKLFSGLKPQGDKKRGKTAIVNMDDRSGAAMADYSRVPVISYGLGDLCHVRATDIELSAAGTRYRLVYGGEIREVQLKLRGRFNIYNSLAAIAAALVESIDIDTIISALEKIESVAGRFQLVVSAGVPYQMVVDYSHTPDSLENCLSTAREICQGKVISVFGAGGHRDTSKRPVMGEIAARLSDVAILTSDNPRDEDPMEIIREVKRGM
ncbi:MAG: UDP-N-acetylmuramoyl-L-alanyl-D-glutamate--2,6-diaminopimelate ligase, partial [Peptococcaceae bacterium]|nr:UDP-N-acetylmuramoyl-L-alanyl-D-glutamate--2,6-diaminopimelate ligase [Peptococcaceae bacterium]